MQNCPCGTGKAYIDCCGIFIDGYKLPETPEALMRSRYTAYTQANVAYIADTMKAPASNNFNPETAYQWAVAVNWEKLKVIKASVSEKKGFVEFIAYFSEEGVRRSIHEISQFQQENGKWFYVEGRMPRQNIFK